MRAVLNRGDSRGAGQAGQRSLWQQEFARPVLGDQRVRGHDPQADAEASIDREGTGVICVCLDSAGGQDAEQGEELPQGVGGYRWASARGVLPTAEQDRHQRLGGALLRHKLAQPPLDSGELR